MLVSWYDGQSKLNMPFYVYKRAGDRYVRFMLPELAQYPTSRSRRTPSALIQTRRVKFWISKQAHALGKLWLGFRVLKGKFEYE
jgi:hypothetical protein